MSEDIRKRFQIQTLSAQIHREMAGPLERQCNCLRALHRSSVVDLLKKKGSERAYYVGLQTCGSVWSCPICGTKITEARRKEVEDLIELTKDKYHYLITLTIPHYKHQSCKEVLTKFKAARRRLKNWTPIKYHLEYKPYTETLKHYKYDGSVTTVEVTYGDNGWHIHSHEMIITEEPIEDLKAFRADVYANWTKSVLYSGIEIKKPNAFWKRSVQIDALHGNHLQRIAAYMNKVVVFEPKPSSWGMAEELTKGTIKKADNKNVTPFGMLHAINDETDPEEKKWLFNKYKKLFWEYVSAFKGSQMIYFSTGLKKKYGMADKKDAELVKMKTIEEMLEEVVCAELEVQLGIVTMQYYENKKRQLDQMVQDMYGHFEIHEWKEIKKYRLRGFVLQHSNLPWNDLLDMIATELKQRKNKNNEQTKNKTLSNKTGRVPCSV